MCSSLSSALPTHTTSVKRSSNLGFHLVRVRLPRQAVVGGPPICLQLEARQPPARVVHEVGHEHVVGRQLKPGVAHLERQP